MESERLESKLCTLAGKGQNYENATLKEITFFIQCYMLMCIIVDFTLYRSVGTWLIFSLWHTHASYSADTANTVTPSSFHSMLPAAQARLPRSQATGQPGAVRPLRLQCRM